MTKLEAWKAWCESAGTPDFATEFTLEQSSHGKAFSFAWERGFVDGMQHQMQLHVNRVIKTWSERCEEHPDHQERIISERMIQERMQEEIDELRQALETEQEPVCWTVADGWVYANDTSRVGTSKEVNWETLYTAPPKREWVGLNHFDRTLLRTTHAPLKPIYHDKNNSACAEVVSDWDVFFDAVEAKLKERNHG